MKSILLRFTHAAAAVAFFSFLGLASGGEVLLELSGDRLEVSAGTEKSATYLAVPTIDQKVTVDSTQLQVSFGRDSRGELSAIVSCSPDGSADVTCMIFGHQVELDKASVLTATLINHGAQVVFDPGSFGKVVLDSKPISAAATVSGPMAGPRPALPTAAAKQVSPPANVGTSSSGAKGNSIPPSLSPVGGPLDAPASGEAKVPDAATRTESSQKITSLDAPTVDLASSFRQKNPGFDAVVIPPAQQVTQEDVRRMKAANQMAEKQFFWAEPVTPPDPSQAMAIAPNESRLAEIHGDVRITTAQGKSVVAKEGQAVESNCTYVSGDNSSLAVLIGGVDSVRITPNTTVSITSTLAGDMRTTLVDLKQGLVFNKVGHREGEKQDYRVQTPSGTAVARGTDFGTSFHQDRMVAMCAEGVVEVFDSSSKLVGTAAPHEAHTLAYFSVGGAAPSPSTRAQDILQVLSVAGSVNGKVNALLDRQAAGQPLTPTETAYLSKIAIVELAVMPLAANDPILVNRQLPAPAQVQGLVAPNPQTAESLQPTSAGQPDVKLPVPDPVNPTPVAAPATPRPNLNPLATDAAAPPLATPF